MTFRLFAGVLLIAALSLTSPALGQSSDPLVLPPAPPSCATTPVATQDPETTPPLPSFAVPPGGSCSEVTRGDGSQVIELRYPDGRLWAEWTFAPVVQGTIYHLANGSTLSIIAEGVSSYQPPTVRLASAKRRILVFGSRSAENYGRSCPSRVPVIKGRAGQQISIYLPRTPARAWVADRRGGAKQLPAAKKLTWSFPARPTTTRLLAFGVRDAQGATGFYLVCVQPVS